MPLPVDNWVLKPKPNAEARLRLFCFPYAGASSVVFRDWPEKLPAEVEVCLVELPGRGRRMREPLHDRLLPLVQTTLAGLQPHLDKPFAFFGHSMGAVISFELARALRRHRLAAPRHLFVSGNSAPQLPGQERPLHNLPDPEFLAELRRLNGTPAEVMQHAELMQLLLPILRADFAVCETHLCAAEPPLDCPITAFGGREDHRVRPEDLAAWQQQTTATFTLHLLPGDHFFIHSAQARLLELLGQALSEGKAG